MEDDCTGITAFNWWWLQGGRRQAETYWRRGESARRRQVSLKLRVKSTTPFSSVSVVFIPRQPINPHIPRESDHPFIPATTTNMCPAAKGIPRLFLRIRFWLVLFYCSGLDDESPRDLNQIDEIDEGVNVTTEQEEPCANISVTVRMS